METWREIISSKSYGYYSQKIADKETTQAKYGDTSMAKTEQRTPFSTLRCPQTLTKNF